MSPLSDFAIGIGVALLSFLIQIRPRLKNRAFGVDSWRHLDEAEEFRKHKSLTRPPERYLIDKPSDYPPLLRVALSLVPKETLERYEWMVAPLFDALHNVFLFAVVWSWTRRVDVAVVAQLTYCLSPLVIMENSNLTTRSFASLLFSLGWLPLMNYLVTGKVIWLGVSILVLGHLFLAHRLALQALFFLSIAWTVWAKTPIFLMTLIAAMVVAVVLSKGFYFKVLWGQLTMLNYWRINIANRFAHQIRGLPKQNSKEPDVVFRIYQIIRRAPFIAVLAANPFSIFLFPWLMHREWLHVSFYGVPPVMLQSLLFWAVALWCIGFLIRQWGPVRFLGEGERYLEYGAFPTAVLAALFIVHQWQGQNPWFWWAAYVLFAVIFGLLPGLILQRQVVSNDVERSVGPELMAIFNHLNGMTQEIRIFTVPLYLASATMHFTKPHIKVLTTDSSYAHLTDLTDLLPVLKIPMEEVTRRYRLTHLLISDHYVTLPELSVNENDVVMKSARFCLVDLMRLQAKGGAVA